MLESVQMKRSNQFLRQGFTLLELMIVLGVLGLIMYFLVPRFGTMLNKARVRTARLAMQTLKNSITMYKVDVGDFPERLRDLIKKPSEEKAAKKWEGPYFDDKELPNDPWGDSYKYDRTQTGYDLYSYGPNGKGAPKDEYIRAE